MVTRSDVDTGVVTRTVFGGGSKFARALRTLTGDITLATDTSPLQIIDPGGAGRNVTLPAASKGLFYVIVNTADAVENLTIKNAGGTTVGVIGPNLLDWFFCDGTNWFNAGSAGGVFVVSGTSAAASYATVGAQTYTAADILGGVIVRDPAGASRTDVLPTAALLVAALPGVQVGDMIECKIVNGADAAETITVNAGTGGGFDTNQTAASRVIPQNTSKHVYIRFTNVGSGTEAYVAYL